MTVWYPAEVFVKGYFEGVGCGTCGSHRNAEKGVGAEFTLVFGSVEIDHESVDFDLLQGVVTYEFGRQLFR